MTTDPIRLKAGWLLWFSGLAVAITITVLLVDSRARAEPATGRPVPGSDGAVNDLAIRVGNLEREVALLRSLLTSGGSEAEPLLVQGVPDALAGRAKSELDARLGRLEAFESERQQALAAELAEDAQDDALERERELARRELAHAIILDRGRSDLEKVQAWRDLRKLDIDPWTDEVVLEMLSVANSPDAEIREDVWKGADSKHTNGLLLGPLLNALARDPETAVREEAADALSRYLGEPGVKEALQRASELDADDKVRAQALEALLDG